MLKLLERGLNFTILPLKLDITQVLVEYKRYERRVLWQEFFHNNQSEEPYVPPIFKSRKTNRPKKHKTPNELKNFLGAVKSEIMDPKNRRKAENNLPKDEAKALKDLVDLQRKRQIQIKQCDKGAGVFIVDFDDYVKSCDSHLKEEQIDEKGNKKKYYREVDQETIQEASSKIKLLLEEGIDNQWLSKQEYEAMWPEGKKASKFYCNFKVHKDHDHGELPPVRPIVSVSGGILENPSAFVDHHIKELGTKHNTYLQDTPDFLRKIEEINENGPLPDNAILVTLDVKSLYTNIPHEEGIKCAEEGLNERVDKTIPTGFIVRMLSLLLHNNIFEYNGKFYSQEIGAAMGVKAAPNYANNFMSKKIDKKIQELSEKYNKNGYISLKLMKRFLDDIFQIFIGTTRELHAFFGEINQIHPNIKFTIAHTSNPKEKECDKCDCSFKTKIPFLDTSCEIIEGKIILDLYRKPTDRNMYLLMDSCHPPHQKENIPFSLAMRIVRICSTPEKREIRFQELLELLQNRDYPKGIIEAALGKARKISREQALRRVVKPLANRRPVFVVSWDPRLPDLGPIQQKHWRAMTTLDPYLKEVFPEPPLLAYKRQKNLKDICIRARIPKIQPKFKKRNCKGMKKCMKQCPICPFVCEGKNIKTETFTWNINTEITCQTENLVYMVKCTKERCKESIYIGETERSLKERITEHIQYIKSNNKKQATGYHFNQPGHSLHDMIIMGIEKPRRIENEYRQERESYLIRKFNCFYKGMNRMP